MQTPAQSSIRNATRRIVTISPTPVQVGPRVIQVANDRQPLVAHGVNIQLRDEHPTGVAVEAVRIEDGALIASEGTVSLAVAAACAELGLNILDLPDAA